MAFFEIRLDKPTTAPVIVRGQTMGMSATQGSDYTGVDEDFSIPSGITALRIGVAIINDQAIESDESFKFVLSNARGGVIGVAEAVVSIVSDDVDTTPSPGPGPVDPNAFLSIGSTKYSSMQAALDAVAINGKINIHYNGGVHVGAKCLGAVRKACSIEAVPGPNGEKPKVAGGVFDLASNGNYVLKSGVWVTKSILNPMARLSLKGFIMSGARKTPTGGNGACAWVEPSCPFITFDDMVFEDSETSVLTPTDHQSLVVEFINSLTQRCGHNSGSSHNVYIGRAGEIRALKSTWRSNTGGHTFKSRANRCVLTDCTFINDTQGRALDIPDGGYFRILRGLVRKTPNVGMGELIGFKRESQHDSQGRTHDGRIDGATLDNQRSSGSVVYNSAPTPFVVAGCTMPGLKTMQGQVTVI